MFIALVGTPSAGRKTVLRYLEEKHGFREIGLQKPSEQMDAARISSNQLDVPVNSLSISEDSSPNLTPSELTPSSIQSFKSPSKLLDYTTRNWLLNHVTTDLKTYEEIEPFIKRPFFLLVVVDGPLRTRFEREQRRGHGKAITLEDFIDQHDLLLNGTHSEASSSKALQLHTDFRRVQNLANISINNNFSSIQGLYNHLDELNLLNEERLRPGWDTYFMTLASLASHRSNCMKRRVGALLVRSKRILSTGYNGTPRGLTNCNQGGCARCNGSARGGEALDECLCLHAEENALLEAGRDRIGDDSVLYCNTCPCLRCSVKIVQTGVREVVYNQSYSMDAASAMVLKEGGVLLRQYHIPFLVGESI